LGERDLNGCLLAIAERTGLDYLLFDCGETQEGELPIIEIGTNMIVHSMDPPDPFPYKRPQMEKVFGAFQAMSRNRSAELTAGVATMEWNSPNYDKAHRQHRLAGGPG
jgi:hypothetical protein